MPPANPQDWLDQQMNRMAHGINSGKTRRRNRESCRSQGVTKKMIIRATRAKHWRVAEIGDDYVWAPRNYAIKPLV